MSRHLYAREPSIDRQAGDRPRGSSAAARLGVAAAVSVLSLVLPAPAFAHGDESGVPARESVLQAIAYVVNTPGDMDMITDKLNDAKESPDRSSSVPFSARLKCTMVCSVSVVFTAFMRPPGGRVPARAS